MTQKVIHFSEEDLNNLPEKKGFRLRGLKMTRLETFMDAAFAFATSMFVISVWHIPKNYQELMYAIKDIPSFICSFVIIMLFWFGHRNWSRRYGLEDMKTIVISISIIFVLLVYIYPLRLMFSALFAIITSGWLPMHFTFEDAQTELTGLFIIYGIGIFCLAGLMALLYFRAKLAAILLKLNPLELLQTKSDIFSFIIVAAIGLISAIFSWLMPVKYALYAGFFYFALPVILPISESCFKKKRKKIH